MSGILDNKSRVIDAIVTLEGRRQLAAGDLRVEYVSFTDAGTYYRGDVVSGSSDATTRIFLESCNLPQDQIAFEADDSGKLKPFNNASGLQVKDGQILGYSFQALTSSVFTGSIESVRFLKGDEFASTSETLLGSSVDNFKNLRIISTRDLIFEDDGFGVGTKNIEFMIHNTRPIQDPKLFTAHINHLDSLFNDVRLSRVKNFHFLPPINRVDDDTLNKADPRETSKHHLGHYRPWGRTQVDGLSYAQIKHELKYYDDLGYSKTITFDPTSRDNKLVAQFFEKNYNQLKKLDVIDFGQHKTGDPQQPLAHIFFVGKVMVDENETHTFIHIFTLVFE